MSFYSVILLAISLSMDALGIGISYGLRIIKIPLNAKFIICAISMIFTGCAVFIGNLISAFLPDFVAKIIGSLMLVILGGIIIFEALFKNNSKDKKTCVQKTSSFMLKPFGITIKIIRDPIYCDFDNSHHISSIEAMYLGGALSIDSFGAGISSSVMGVNSLLIPVFAGVCQLVFLCVGGFLGKYISSFKKIKPKFFVVISGFLLICLAAIRWTLS